jgi:hypothetical protein
MSSANSSEMARLLLSGIRGQKREPGNHNCRICIPPTRSLAFTCAFRLQHIEHPKPFRRAIHPSQLHQRIARVEAALGGNPDRPTDQYAAVREKLALRDRAAPNGQACADCE